MRKIVLISCTKRKKAHAAPAGELYESQWFRLALAYARSLRPDGVFILSARHGLLDLDAVIEPYDLTLNDMTARQVEQWAAAVLGQLKDRADLANDHFIFLASDRYRKHLLPHLRSYEIPMKGLTIGRQLAFLKKRVRA